jgi:phage terminase Nu1 subunit (DNA packaging protein)
MPALQEIFHPMKPKPKATKKAPSLSTDQVEKIRSANIGNIIKKVKAGKSLTAAEFKILNEAGTEKDEPELVTTSQLADLFGINRKTIAEWRKIKRRGIPAKVGTQEDVAAWQKFFDSNPSAGHFDGKPRADRETLLCDKLIIETKTQQLKYDRMAEILISRGEVAELLTKIGTALSAMIARAIVDIPGVIEGLPRNKSAPILKAKMRELQAKLADLEGEFWKDHVEKEAERA